MPHLEILLNVLLSLKSLKNFETLEAALERILNFFAS